MWDTLRHVLNFTYTIFENQAWGSLESDSGHSSWNGLIGIMNIIMFVQLHRIMIYQFQIYKYQVPYLFVFRSINQRRN